MKKIVIIFTLIFISTITYADMQSAIDALNAKNYKQAFNEFMTEAKAGNADAMNYLGGLYSKGLGVKQDYSKAINWYSKSIKYGSYIANNNLGTMYQHGLGVKQDYSKAINLYQKAINFDIPIAFYNLGTMYQHGLGVKQDYSKAINLYQKASDFKYPKAESILGTIYYIGDLNARIDYKKAYELIHSASLAGLPAAQMSLGTLYMEGKAVKQDYQKAYTWYYISYKNGNEKSSEGMEQASVHLNQKQIDSAKQQAEEWMKNHKEIDTALTTVNNGITIPVN